MPPNKPLQRTWQRCADIDRGRVAESQASSAVVQGCATPLNADPLGCRGGTRRMVFHFVFGLSLFCAAVHLYRERASGLTRARVVEVLLLYILCVQWGFGGAFLSIPHILMPDPIAESIGCCLLYTSDAADE